MYPYALQSTMICLLSDSCCDKRVNKLASPSTQDHSELNSTVIRSPTNTVIIRGLKQGTIYVFQVRARTVAGFGRYSGKLYFQTMTEGENSFGIFITLR